MSIAKSQLSILTERLVNNRTLQEYLGVSESTLFWKSYDMQLQKLHKFLKNCQQNLKAP